MTDKIAEAVADLRRRMASQTDAEVAKLLAAIGIDPADRTEGWEDRARAALGGFKLETTYHLSDDDTLVMWAETTIRPA